MYLSHLYPKPKFIKEDEDNRFVFGSKLTAKVNGLSADMAERAKYLWNRFSFGACDLLLEEGGDNYTFTAGNAKSCLKGDDTYSIIVTPEGVSVSGHDEKGLMDGIKTAVQLICPDNLKIGEESLYISAVEIHDSPAVLFRAIHFCIFPDTELYNIEKAIHLAGFLKMTHVILEFWGTFRYDCLPELSWSDRSHSKEDYKKLVRLIRSYGMEPIPMSNQLGHATQSRAMYGRHVVLNTNPRLARLFEPDGWTWCITNPDTKKLLSEIRNELIDFFGNGRYFHLGFDESYSFASCDRCRKHIPHELLAEFLNESADDLRKKGRRSIVWHDQFIRRSDFGEGPVVASGENKNTAAAIDLIDKDIIIADWEYWNTKRFNVTTKYFMDKGFDTVVCPWLENENVLSLDADAKELKAYGILQTTWQDLPSWLSKATFAASCAWQEGEEEPYYAVTENAAILRNLYDTKGDFISSGWNINEVVQ